MIVVFSHMATYLHKHQLSAHQLLKITAHDKDAMLVRRARGEPGWSSMHQSIVHGSPMTVLLASIIHQTYQLFGRDPLMPGKEASKL